VERVDPGACTPSLFQDGGAARQRTLDSVADAVAQKYGPDALRRAGSRAGGRRTRRDGQDGPRPEAG
jgi:hypothetical protein